MVNILSPSGLYIGRQLGIRVDGSRLKRSIARITKGLYFHVTGEILSPSTSVMGFTPDEFDREDMKALFTMFVNNLRTFPQTSIGDGVFSFRCHVYEVDPSASYWLFVFFDSVGFLGLTGPRPGTPSLTSR